MGRERDRRWRFAPDEDRFLCQTNPLPHRKDCSLSARTVCAVGADAPLQPFGTELRKDSGLLGGEGFYSAHGHSFLAAASATIRSHAANFSPAACATASIETRSAAVN